MANNINPEQILSFILIGTFLIAWVWLLKRGAIGIVSSEAVEEDIKKDLMKKGMKLVEIKTPKAFDTGPFPKFGISIGIQTNIAGFRGEKTRYRIVKYKDGKDQIKESWVKLEFVAFSLVSIKWSPEI
ncbi:hypothetical protein E7Z59_10320 [Robertkochia marina]|uniref:Uncharacterized protein n=1 Tax=Robertkochia marina TaxID=1227945 RepID=A0A4S3M0S5_9FLAO|nr:hypothetical protein [Robertkochia marina]THD68032.1 hypothetical protein E7Z59_10320 [Robertkochia marina]TRZ42684.1 hypothetical protein D3A96_11645 [Robertkochia marina]